MIERAGELGVAIELNGDPHRLDLDWRYIRFATERGVRIAITTDAHSPAGLANLRYGVGLARKGWLTPSQCLNTLSGMNCSRSSPISARNAAHSLTHSSFPQDWSTANHGSAYHPLGENARRILPLRQARRPGGDQLRHPPPRSSWRRSIATPCALAVTP